MSRLALALIFSLSVASSVALAQTPQPAAAGPIRFEDATDSSGIQFTHSFGAEKLGSLLEGTGGGCVWFDYNNDGFPDLYVVSGKPLEGDIHPYPLKKAPEVPPHNHLFRNNGNGTFTDVTDQAGIGANIYGMAAIAADFDNDGFIDLFVTGYGRAILYHNNGDGTFTDVTAKAGINVDGWSISSAWLDYDRDGCVDLFVGRYVKFDPKYRAFYAADNYPGRSIMPAIPTRLYHNNCNGTFTDVTDASGIGAYKGRTMGVTAADLTATAGPTFTSLTIKPKIFCFTTSTTAPSKKLPAILGVAYGQNGEIDLIDGAGVCRC